MPKSKSTKAKTLTKIVKKESNTAEAKRAETAAPHADHVVTPEQVGNAGSAKSAESTKYKSSKPRGLTHKQKAALARQLMLCAGDLMDVLDTKFNDEALVGIDRKFMGVQLSTWVSYLPGQYWDARLPQPIRARGRRKL